MEEYNVLAKLISLEEVEVLEEHRRRKQQSVDWLSYCKSVFPDEVKDGN